MIGLEPQGLPDIRDEVDRRGARTERVGCCRERADHVDDDNSARDTLEFPSIQLPTHHRTNGLADRRAVSLTEKLRVGCAEVTGDAPLNWMVGDVRVTRVE